MIGIIIYLVDPVRHGPLGQINLTANNRLDPGGFRRLVEINTAVHDPMIGNGNGRLTQLLDPVHHAADTASAVQKTVFRMNMKMYKTHDTISLAISTNFLSL